MVSYIARFVGNFLYRICPNQLEVKVTTCTQNWLHTLKMKRVFGKFNIFKGTSSFLPGKERGSLILTLCYLMLILPAAPVWAL
jgi:hypothetical protein